YVIVAYMTSSACPHGAYILKKQDQYESSLGINGEARQPNDSKPSSNSAVPNSKSSDQTGSAASQASSATRPRRVGIDQNSSPSTTQVAPAAQSSAPVQQQIAQNQDDSTRPAGPPTLLGSTTPRPLRPPTLTNAGNGQTESSATNDATPSTAAAQPGPE